MSLSVNSGFNGITEPEVQTYIEKVESTDGQLIEFAVAKAINDFVLGCKNDGIWNAIKASCILAGARTLSGALIPLKGTAPTNFNFVSGDYNRKTGLVGDGSTKYLNSNRSNDGDPQDSNHNIVYVSTLTSTLGALIGTAAETSGTNYIETSTTNSFGTRCRNATISNNSPNPTSGFMGFNRNSSSSYSIRYSGTQQTVSISSQYPSSYNVNIFRRDAATPKYANHRIAFYSIGESLDLALLDARVTTLINTFNSVIA